MQQNKGSIIQGPRPKDGFYWICRCDDVDVDHSHTSTSVCAYPVSWAHMQEEMPWISGGCLRCGDKNIARNGPFGELYCCYCDD